MKSNFDEEYKEREKIILIASIITVIFRFSVVGFAIWAIIRVMMHFGII